MKPYETTVDAANALRRLAPGVGRTFSLLPDEIAQLSINSEVALYFQLKSSGTGAGECFLTKRDIQRILRSEAQRILLRRSYVRSKPPAEAAADEARRVIARVEDAVPADSAARLVLDHTLGRRELRSKADHRKYELGIPALSNAIQKALTGIYGAATAAVFRQSVGAVALLAGSGTLVQADEATRRAASLDQLAVQVNEFRRLRHEKEYWRRIAQLDSDAQYVLFGLQQGSSRAAVKQVYEEKYRSQSAFGSELAPDELTPSRMEFNTHIRTIEEVFGIRH